VRELTGFELVTWGNSLSSAFGILAMKPSLRSSLAIPLRRAISSQDDTFLLAKFFQLID
jgi:hypothetical protein